MCFRFWSWTNYKSIIYIGGRKSWEVGFWAEQQKLKEMGGPTDTEAWRGACSGGRVMHAQPFHFTFHFMMQLPSPLSFRLCLIVCRPGSKVTTGTMTMCIAIYLIYIHYIRPNWLNLFVRGNFLFFSVNWPILP